MPTDESRCAWCNGLLTDRAPSEFFCCEGHQLLWFRAQHGELADDDLSR